MRLTILSIACLLVLSGCESDQERILKAKEKKIQETTQTDWHSGIPLDDLVDADKMCKEHPDLKYCDTLQAQMQDIAITLNSCRQNQRSRLCQAVVEIIGIHPISSTLPKVKAIQLPDTPFYWSLSTAVLEAQAGNFGYRKQAASWWWESWHTIILSCFALLGIANGVWVWLWNWKNKQRQRAASLARQYAARIEQQHMQEIRTKQARIEKEHQIEMALKKELAEQQRIASESHAKQQATDAAATLAAERAEAARLLSSVFSPTKTKINPRKK